MTNEVQLTPGTDETRGRGRRGRGALTVVALGIALCLTMGVAHAEESFLHREIVWSEYSGRPYFVPQDRLPLPGDPDLDFLLSERERSSLLWAVSLSKGRIAQGGVKHCQGMGNTPRETSQESYLEALLDLVLRTWQTGPAPGWVIALGTIEDAVVGWDGAYGKVTTRSLLRLRETLFDEADRLTGAEQVTFLDARGILHYGGTELCSSNYTISDPQVGDQIVLVGWMSDQADGRVLHRFHFIVEEGVLLPEPYIRFENPPEVTLDDLRQGIRARVSSESVATNP